MRLINADRIREEIKECDRFFAYDDYDKGMREGIRRALMRISETETVNLEEIQANERRKFAEWLCEKLDMNVDRVLEEYERERK